MVRCSFTAFKDCTAVGLSYLHGRSNGRIRSSYVGGMSVFNPLDSKNC